MELPSVTTAVVAVCAIFLSLPLFFMRATIEVYRFFGHFIF